MLRLRVCFPPARRRLLLPSPLRHRPSSSTTTIAPATSQTEPPPPPPRHLSPSLPPSSLHSTTSSISPLLPPSPSSSSASYVRYSLLALSASLLAFVYSAGPSRHADPDDNDPRSTSSVIDGVLHRSNDSLRRFYRHVIQMGVAASVLWQSLVSVLSSANQEVRAGFELRVASLLADIAAANSGRRAAIVGAGDGRVVDWLLDTVAVEGYPRGGCAVQAEAARAVAYLVADERVSEEVLGRPGAVGKLLRFIFSCQPQRSKKQTRRSSFDVSDSLKGRSMLIAAIMDIVTSNCDSLDKVSFKPSLSKHAEMRDIAAAIEAIEEGGLHMDEPGNGGDDEDGDSGLRGIGIKILEGTAVIGLSRTNELATLDHSDSGGVEGARMAPKKNLLYHNHGKSAAETNVSLAVVPGLWDDLHCEHVAVPFAAWALANWAMSSELNRSHIQELDQDGYAIMTALAAPERSVKWHGCLVARSLLEDQNLPLNDSVPDWSSSLLSIISKASIHEDIPLAQVALSAFLVSVERSLDAQRMVMDKGLHLLRESAKLTSNHTEVQEALARAIELLFTKGTPVCFEESQRWSPILLQWVCAGTSSEVLRSSGSQILSRMLEKFGSSSLPLSQAWLAILLSETLRVNKPSKGNMQWKNTNVKSQVDQSFLGYAGQVVNQLAGSVVNLAASELGPANGSSNVFLLEDLLYVEPFAGPLKNLKKQGRPRITAAESAVATLKAVKVLTELCAEDGSLQERLSDSGVLHLLRRLLMSDDYEKLAATEAYDASRKSEFHERGIDPSTDTSVSENTGTLNLKVPPTAHIRKHAARLLNVLSLLPKVQKIIVKDEALCRWLEDCANGKSSTCSDPKMQSYARATLLNVFCNVQLSRESLGGSGVQNHRTCPQYSDAIFLINPQMTHWKCTPLGDKSGANDDESSADRSTPVNNDNRPGGKAMDRDNLTKSVDSSYDESSSDLPPIDVVFVHGLRGGPFKSWRITEDKTSTKSGLVEKIDQEAGKHGTFWPAEWLPIDFPHARLFSLKYKTNLTQWTGATLPLQEVSSMLLRKLVAAGIGDRPVVFITHSMGGLVVKQLLHKAKMESIDNLVKNTVGIVFYSCPHFGSKLADMPWRMGLVLRPAPTIGELRSGSPRLIELNDFIRQQHKKGLLEVLSFCETKVTPLVKGYGGWAFRLEVVPIESAYPGFGDLVVLESTDHINSCKPVNQNDPSYTETLNFLRKLKAYYT
ncbi:hypothetical protein MLD38_022299 [Melastoma candidum]|uniref:Uncharacterized protein n=1 Tax=Melastoma candidum TaxID=119954 RepID=A0ACB9QI54_9MYRT|nr:hypothetical protein MLD38_022299 [Melastoma candidum]